MLTKKTLLFTGTALGSSCREKGSHSFTPTHMGAAHQCTVCHSALSVERSECHAKGDMSKLGRLLRPLGGPDCFLLYPSPPKAPLFLLSHLSFRLNIFLPLLFPSVPHYQECGFKIHQAVVWSLFLNLPSYSVKVSLPSSTFPLRLQTTYYTYYTSGFFLFCSLMILVMACRWKLRRSQILSVTAFIFQLSNPRSSLSPVFWESAPKPKSCSQFTRRPRRHYFVHTAMILPSLKFISYISIKDAVCLAEKDRIHHACIYKHPHQHTQSIYLYAFIYSTYLLSSLHFGRSDNSKGMNAH